MTDIRIAEGTAPSFASRRARRDAERAAELAALDANAIGPSPISAPTPVVAAAAVLEPAAAAPIDLGELIAELAAGPLRFPVAEPAPVHTVRNAATRPAHGRRPSAARAFLSGIAMLAVAGLGVCLALPSFAPSGADAATTGSAVPPVSTAGGQALDLGDTAVAAAGSDPNYVAFSSQSYASVMQQKYAEAGQELDPTYIPTAGAIRWPFSSEVAISAPYGYSKQYAFGWHDGIDFVPGYGVPAHAIMGGVVTWVGAEGELGYSVHIDTKVDGHTIEAIYGHMITGSSKLYPGETVAVGVTVGKTGQTGEATGPHLHLGIMVDGDLTDPYVWLSLHATNKE